PRTDGRALTSTGDCADNRTNRRATACEFPGSAILADTGTSALRQISCADFIPAAVDRYGCQVHHQVGCAANPTALGYRSDDDLRIRSSRNHNIPFGVVHVSSYLRGKRLPVHGLA